MSNVPRSIKRLRTFANDLEEAKQAAGLAVSAHPVEAELTNTEQPAVSTESDTQQVSKIPTKPLPVRHDTKAPAFDDIINEQPVTTVPSSTKKPRPESKEEEADSVSEENPTTTDSTPAGSTPPKEQAPITLPKEITDFEDESVIYDTQPNSSIATEDGTIITDQKKDRFKLLPATISAVVDWAAKLFDTYTTKAPDERVVARAETRREILEKAAEKSALAPTDDYGNITKQKGPVDLKDTENNSTISIKKASEVAPPQWSYFSEEKSSNTPTETNSDQTNEAPVLEQIPSDEKPAIRKQKEQDAVVTTPPVTRERTETITPSPLKDPDPVYTTPEEPTSAPTTPTVQTPAPKPKNLPTRTQRQPAIRSSSALIYYAMVSIVAVLLGVGTAYWLFMGNPDNSTIATNQIEENTLIESDTTGTVVLGNDGKTFLRTIVQSPYGSPGTITELQPVVASNEGERVATVEEILTVLDPRAPGSFIRSIEAISIGFDGTQTPYIVLRVRSFETSFAGMIAWEESISNDLSPLFGAPVTGTFDARSRSANAISQPFFTDTVVANYDVRVLRDERLEDRITYSFIDRNTILITTTTEALTGLAPEIK